MTHIRTGQFSFDDKLNINVVASEATEQPQAEKQQRLDLDGMAQAWTDATNPKAQPESPESRS
jgi:hypothetical protein